MYDLTLLQINAARYPNTKLKEKPEMLKQVDVKSWRIYFHDDTMNHETVCRY